MRRVVKTAREVLNELRWGGADRLPQAVLWYRDRTRPESHRLIRGSEIVELERRYFVTASGRLPYYKIERIEVDGKVVFERSDE
jgi:uncharacterized protein (UPF0248 family)